MTVLLVGNGGREHAIAWKLLRDDPSIEIICAPGNAGIAEIAHCIPVDSADINGLLAFAKRADIDLTVIGPEGPLAAGVVDLFAESGLPIFGPTRAAAEIETSKRFAKSLMNSAGVPTGAATCHTDADNAHRAAIALGTPAVIKASGLAAGKGVVVARSTEEAGLAIDMMLRDRAFGGAGAEILVEEFMEGEELSFFAITDGTEFIPMIAAQDHKRLLDDDLGPNTGGMGAYAPVSIATPDLEALVQNTIFEPVLMALRECGRPFRGLLYAGVIVTATGPRVVEFNCRFGDPETQALLPLMRSPLLDMLLAVGRGESLAGAKPIEWEPMHSVATVLASHGYPGVVRTGDAIHMPAPPRGIEVFHAATARLPGTAQLVTAGGRVLTVTGVADTIAGASACSRSHAERITFSGKQSRRDIAWRELERGAGAT